MAELVEAVPRWCSPSTPIPTTPTWPAAAPWPAGPPTGCQVHLVVCTDGGRGTTDPIGRPGDAGPSAGRGAGRGGRAGGARLPSGARRDRRRAGGQRRACGASWSAGSGGIRPGGGLRARPDRRLLRSGLLQPPRPPHRRVGAARRAVPGGRPAALLPRGRATPPGDRGLPLGHARTRRVGRHLGVGRGQGGGGRVPPQPVRRPTAAGPARSCAAGPRRRAGGPASPTPRASAGCGSVAEGPDAVAPDGAGTTWCRPSCTSTWTPSSPRWRCWTTRAGRQAGHRRRQRRPGRGGLVHLRGPGLRRALGHAVGAGPPALPRRGLRRRALLPLRRGERAAARDPAVGHAAGGADRAGRGLPRRDRGPPAARAARGHRRTACGPGWPTSCRSTARSGWAGPSWWPSWPPGRPSRWPTRQRQAARPGRGGGAAGRGAGLPAPACRWRRCGGSARPPPQRLHDLGVRTVGRAGRRCPRRRGPPTRAGPGGSSGGPGPRRRPATRWSPTGRPSRSGTRRPSATTSSTWPCCSATPCGCPSRWPCSSADSRAGRPHGDRQGEVRRLLAGDPLAHAARRHRHGGRHRRGGRAPCSKRSICGTRGAPARGERVGPGAHRHLPPARLRRWPTRPIRRTRGRGMAAPMATRPCGSRSSWREVTAAVDAIRARFRRRAGRHRLHGGRGRHRGADPARGPLGAVGRGRPGPQGGGDGGAGPRRE